MEGLPLLPGYSFRYSTSSRFHLSQQFDFKNGYRMPRLFPCGVGNELLDVQGTRYIKEPDHLSFDPSLTYGRCKLPAAPLVVPHFVTYSGKCITFRAFFKQSVFESQLEHYRVRHVNIIYFLEDDTITVMEPPVDNSGLVQGKLVSRGKIPKNTLGEHWHWKDFNIGIDVALYGVVYHIVDCDVFTKEYLASQGVELNSPEEMPFDPYITERRMRIAPTTTVTPSLDGKLRRFLEFGGKTLRFYVAWDDRESEYGDLRPCIIFYDLADDTVQVKEDRQRNDGREPSALLLKKMKLPKDWKDIPVDFEGIYLEVSDKEVTAYYTPKDFVVGNTIFVLGRRMLIYDMDRFTRDYYEKMLKITQPPAMENVFGKPRTVPEYKVPPYNGFGSLEDSYNSCLSLIPKVPKKDVIRQLHNANKVLRYTAKLDWVHPEDEVRRFIFVYSLADGTIAIQEPQIQNSGIKGGCFLKNTRIAKPGGVTDNPDYYNPVDFYIGARITAFAHQFVITGADLFVYRYMRDNPTMFPAEVVDNVRSWLAGRGLLSTDVQCRAEEIAEQRAEEEIEAPRVSYDECLDVCCNK